MPVKLAVRRAKSHIATRHSRFVRERRAWPKRLALLFPRSLVLLRLPAETAALQLWPGHVRDLWSPDFSE
jgi:hypothetical protein